MGKRHIHNAQDIVCVVLHYCNLGWCPAESQVTDQCQQSTFTFTCCISRDKYKLVHRCSCQITLKHNSCECYDIADTTKHKQATIATVTKHTDNSFTYHVFLYVKVVTPHIPCFHSQPSLTGLKNVCIRSLPSSSGILNGSFLILSYRL